jgi:hypothetical protein
VTRKQIKQYLEVYDALPERRDCVKAFEHWRNTSEGRARELDRFIENYAEPMEHAARKAGTQQVASGVRRRGAKRRFTDDQIDAALAAKAAGRNNLQIARILYGPNPTPTQRRNVSTVLRYWALRRARTNRAQTAN